MLFQIPINMLAINPILLKELEARKPPHKTKSCSDNTFIGVHEHHQSSGSGSSRSRDRFTDNFTSPESSVDADNVVQMSRPGVQTDSSGTEGVQSSEDDSGHGQGGARYPWVYGGVRAAAMKRLKKLECTRNKKEIARTNFSFSCPDIAKLLEKEDICQNNRIVPEAAAAAPKIDRSTKTKPKLGWRELEEIQVVADTPGPVDGDLRQGRGRDVRAGRVRGGNLNRVEKYFYKALTRICF